MSKDRRHAAIMFTDIVGYTALMGSDEDYAFEVLRKNREIHTKLIEKYKGTLIKEMGDGMLISFNLASNAVRCAIEIQKSSKEQDIPLKIGIHEGEMVFEGADVLGDGVNIASRIQDDTDGGCISISESVYRNIKNKKDIKTQFFKEKSFKNVNEPLKTYSVLGEGVSVPKKQKFTSKGQKEQILKSPLLYIVFLFLLLAGGWWIRNEFFIDQQTITSLAILPFDNFTGDEELDYFVAGMHSSLIGDIGKISALRVISKTTSNAYKDVDKPVSKIASELGVNAVIEASILCLGDSVCVQVRLISTFPEERQLWVQDYYEEKSQILNLYNKVTKEISEEINIVLTPQEENLLAESRTVDPEAYDAYLKGQYYWEKLDKESMEKALEYFQQAIEKDPEWADPYAGLANAWSIFGTLLRVLPKSVTLPKVYEYLDKALELDPNSAKAHYVKALNEVWTKFDWEQGEEEFLTSLRLNPNDALCHIYYAHLLAILRRSDEAIIQGNLALELDPLKPLILFLYRVGPDEDDQSKILRLEKALSIDPNFRMAKVGLKNIHMRAAYADGDYEKWIEIWEKKVRRVWNDEGRAAVLNAFHEKGHIAAIEEMFKMNEKYGKDCWMSGILKAKRYLKLKKYDKATDCLEKEYEKRDMSITYIASDEILCDQLKDNPRYIALLKKMNLPHP